MNFLSLGEIDVPDGHAEEVRSDAIVRNIEYGILLTGASTSLLNFSLWFLLPVELPS